MLFSDSGQILVDFGLPRRTRISSKIAPGLLFEKQLSSFFTIFVHFQIHWTFPNAALVAAFFSHVVRSTLLRIGLSDFAWVGPKLAIPTLERCVQNFDFGPNLY